MVIDTLTIVVGCCVLLLSLAGTLTSPFLRRLRRVDASAAGDEDAQPGMSVVIACHDNAYELERNLPHILSQQYADFEVIVVDESSTDDTDDVLKKLKQQYANLYTTFIPESSHYLSRRKLALTIGVKAAKKEWVVFTDVTCRPASDGWLQVMASQCKADKDIVVGYSNYDDETSAYYRFRRLLACHRAMRKAQASPNVRAYIAASNNIAFRKALFMSNNGFLKNLKYLRGEYDFLVNEYAEKGRTAIVASNEATMIEDAPTHKSWVNTNLYYMETRRHLGRGKMWRMAYDVDNLLLHTAFVADVVAIVLSAMAEKWIMLGVACVALMVLFVVRALLVRRVAKALGETLPTLLVPFMELRTVWTNLVLLVRYKTSNRYDFVRK